MTETVTISKAEYDELLKDKARWDFINENKHICFVVVCCDNSNWFTFPKNDEIRTAIDKTMEEMEDE